MLEGRILFNLLARVDIVIHCMNVRGLCRFVVKELNYGFVVLLLLSGAIFSAATYF